MDEKGLELLAKDALCQIDEKRYASEFYEDGIEKLLKLGIAFSGKKVIIKEKY